jgi:hypothetical protein
MFLCKSPFHHSEKILRKCLSCILVSEASVQDHLTYCFGPQVRQNITVVGAGGEEDSYLVAIRKQKDKNFMGSQEAKQ